MLSAVSWLMLHTPHAVSWRLCYMLVVWQPLWANSWAHWLYLSCHTIHQQPVGLYPLRAHLVCRTIATVFKYIVSSSLHGPDLMDLGVVEYPLPRPPFDAQLGPSRSPRLLNLPCPPYLAWVISLTPNNTLMGLPWRRVNLFTNQRKLAERFLK